MPSVSLLLLSLLEWKFLPAVVRYTYALQALSHALLLSPQNPFTFLQFAETAYSSGDVPLALKMFLIVIDMSEEEADAIPLGISVRAWWGTKLVREPDP